MSRLACNGGLVVFFLLFLLNVQSALRCFWLELTSVEIKVEQLIEVLLGTLRYPKVAGECKCSQFTINYFKNKNVNILINHQKST